MTLDQVHEEIVEQRPDPVRLRYWARLLKLLRDPWPPRTNVPPRTTELCRSAEPTRQPGATRLDESI